MALAISSWNMSPEHFDKSRRITSLTDVFALGTTVYRMLVKEYPFARENTVEKNTYAHPVPVMELQPEIPRNPGHAEDILNPRVL